MIDHPIWQGLRKILCKQSSPVTVTTWSGLFKHLFIKAINKLKQLIDLALFNCTKCLSFNIAIFYFALLQPAVPVINIIAYSCLTALLNIFLWKWSAV
jgi:hypothetical protein